MLALLRLEEEGVLSTPHLNAYLKKVIEEAKDYDITNAIDEPTLTPDQRMRLARYLVNERGDQFDKNSRRTSDLIDASLATAIVETGDIKRIFRYLEMEGATGSVRLTNESYATDSENVREISKENMEAFINTYREEVRLSLKMQILLKGIVDLADQKTVMQAYQRVNSSGRFYLGRLLTSPDREEEAKRMQESTRVARALSAVSHSHDGTLQSLIALTDKDVEISNLLYHDLSHTKALRMQLVDRLLDPLDISTIEFMMRQFSSTFSSMTLDRYVMRYLVVRKIKEATTHKA